MNIKAVLFDHDGTIVDSEFAHFEMWRDILLRYGIEISYQEYVDHYAGIPSNTNARTIADNYSLNVEPEQLILAKAESTAKYLSKQAFPLMPGALESIRYFYDLGLKIGIVTGAGKEGISVTLKKHGLDHYISVAVSGDDVMNSKPAPDCYLLAAEKLGLQSSDCLAIEDTYNGSVSANRANIKCIGVSASSQVRELFTDTIYVCNNLDFATQWISQNCQLQVSS